MPGIKNTGLLAGPLLFLLILWLSIPDGISDAARIVLACSFWMALWWITEAVPIYVTALIPLVVFPMGRVAEAGQVSTAYMDSNIVLFMGGFFLAMSIQKWNLHRRIALTTIAVVGTNGSRLLLGFMIATAFLSMWVSNTATAIMMLPIAVAVIQHLKERDVLRKASYLPTSLMLGIAYSASIGGVATLIGTPPNIVFASQFTSLFPDRPPIGFGQWMLLGVPFSVLFLGLAWIYLSRVYGRLQEDHLGDQIEIIDRERSSLGSMTRGEKSVTIVFVLTALAWIFRRNLELGVVQIPGWANLLGVDEFVHDSTVAVLASLVLFCLPVSWSEREFLLDWPTAAKIPWGILLLFGGGIALARGFQSSGLAGWVGQQLIILEGLPVPLLILSLCLIVSFLTELTSNTATAALLMPVLAGTAGSLNVAAELLMIPATISASCAFMLPVATPPNAIVFGSDYLTIPQMAKAGLAMNIMGAVVTTIVIYLLGITVFQIS